MIKRLGFGCSFLAAILTFVSPSLAQPAIARNPIVCSSVTEFATLSVAAGNRDRQVTVNGVRGGKFLWDVDSAATVDNAITFTGFGGVGRIIRQYTGPVHLDWWDLSGADDTTAIASAIATGKDIIYPAATVQASSLTFNQPNQSHLGIRGRSIIEKVGAEVTPFISIEADGNTLSSLKFDGNDLVARAIAIQDGNTDTTITRCEVDDLGHTTVATEGMWFGDECHRTVITECYIHDLASGPGLAARGIRGSGFTSPTIPIEGVRIATNHIATLTPADDADGITIQDWTVPVGVVIDGNTFRQCTKRCVKINVTPGVIVTNNRCNFEPFSVYTNGATAISYQAGQGVVANNVIDGRWSIGIEVGPGAVDHVVVSGNQVTITEFQAQQGVEVNGTGEGVAITGNSFKLGEPWVTGQTIAIGDYRTSDTDGDNLYVSTSAGTTGATPPTGTGTGINDGGVIWDFVSNSSRWPIRVSGTQKAMTVVGNIGDGFRSDFINFSGGGSNYVVANNIARNIGNFFINGSGATNISAWGNDLDGTQNAFANGVAVQITNGAKSTLTSLDATPSISGLNYIELNFAGTVTAFDDGRDGQVLVVAGSGATLQHGANIAMASGANETISAGESFLFRVDGSTVREVTTTKTGGSGSTTFTGLTDTPANFTGSAGKIPHVNTTAHPDGDALEFVHQGNYIVRVDGTTIRTYDIGTTESSARTAFASWAGDLTDNDVSIFPQGREFKIADTVFTENNIRINFNDCRFLPETAAPNRLMEFQGNKNVVMNAHINMSTGTMDNGQLCEGLVNGGDYNRFHNIECIGSTTETGAGSNGIVIRDRSVADHAWYSNITWDDGSFRFDSNNIRITDSFCFGGYKGHAISCNSTAASNVTVRNVHMVIEETVANPDGPAFINLNPQVSGTTRLKDVVIENCSYERLGPVTSLTANAAVLKIADIETITIKNFRTVTPIPGSGSATFIGLQIGDKLSTHANSVETINVIGGAWDCPIRVSDEDSGSIHVQGWRLDLTGYTLNRFGIQFSADAVEVKNSTFLGSATNFQLLLPQTGILNPRAVLSDVEVSGDNHRIFHSSGQWDANRISVNNVRRSGTTVRWHEDTDMDSFIATKIPGTFNQYNVDVDTLPSTFFNVLPAASFTNGDEFHFVGRKARTYTYDSGAAASYDGRDSFDPPGADTGAILGIDKKILTLTATDTTPSVRGFVHVNANQTAETITDFDDGATGDIITVSSTSSVIIADNANIQLANGANETLDANEVLMLRHNASGVWEEVTTTKVGGGGSSTFVGLTDTPGSITAGGIVKGADAGGALDFTGVLTNGQLLIGDGTTGPTIGTLTGTANELTVTNGAGSITLSLPSTVNLGAGSSFTSISYSITDSLLALDGAFQIGGTGGTNNETITLDFESNANTISATTASGVTAWDWNGINMQDTNLTSSGGNIAVTPSGAGVISLDGQLWPSAGGALNQYLVIDGAGQTSWSDGTVSRADTESPILNLISYYGVGTAPGSAPSGSAGKMYSTFVLNGSNEWDANTYLHDGTAWRVVAAAGGAGDITAVGPEYPTGAAFTDGLASQGGTTLFVFEGSTVNTNELSILSPTADPAGDINITLPSATGNLLARSAGLTSGGLLYSNGNDDVLSLGVATNGQIPIGDGAGAPTLAAPTGTANEINVTTGAGSLTFALSDTINVGDHTSFELPNSATPTVDADGELALDTTITDHTGLLKYYAGAEELTVVGMPTTNLTAVDGHVVAYNATNNEFEMVAPAAGSLDINGLTENADMHPDNDFVPYYDASAGANRKVRPHDIPFGYANNSWTSATATVDWTTGRIQQQNLSGNWTPDAPTNPLKEGICVLVIRQDTTGGRTVDLSSWSITGTVPYIDLGSEKTTVLVFYFVNNEYVVHRDHDIERHGTAPRDLGLVSTNQALDFSVGSTDHIKLDLGDNISITSISGLSSRNHKLFIKYGAFSITSWPASVTVTPVRPTAADENKYWVHEFTDNGEP